MNTMKRFAIIQDYVVTNITVSETKISEDWIELPDHAGIGSTYIDGNFSDFPDLTIPEKEPTKDELLAQIQALMDKVNALPDSNIITGDETPNI